ncbi:MAG: tRNA dihydrouridine synthase DusB [Burkholderiales bacterium]
MQIGPYSLPNALCVAPMAGVTDRAFRKLCKRFGAGLAVSEMIASNPQLRLSIKTQRRVDHEGEVEPIAVQIAGGEPAMLADAARFNVDGGAQIIDINMGCPAKKVCNVAAGSALLRDEALVGRILESVVAAVPVPVTLKIRTGWDRTNRNAVRVARAAEQAGIRAIAIHGRTRADAFLGAAEYDTIAEVKARIGIPVIANGDIDSPEKAAWVLEKTGADGVMIGRAAQGRPWIFREIAHYLEHGARAAPPSLHEFRAVLRAHVAELHAFYGEFSGLRVARKHVSWYTGSLAGGTAFRHTFNKLESARAQLDRLDAYFDGLEREACFYAHDAREELAA